MLRSSHCAFLDFATYAGAGDALRAMNGARLGPGHVSGHTHTLVKASQYVYVYGRIASAFSLRFSVSAFLLLS